MPLLNDAQRTRMLSNGAMRGEMRARSEAFDPFPVVKLYTLDAGAVWLLTDLDSDGDRAFGLCDAGIGCPELGDVHLTALEAMRGPRGMRVVADPDFAPSRTLSAYFAAAVRDGAIND